MNALCASDDRQERRERELVARYGELVGLTELTELLRYPSVAALRQAYYKRRTPFPMGPMPGRVGLFATTRSVSDYLGAFERGELIE